MDALVHAREFAPLIHRYQPDTNYYAIDHRHMHYERGIDEHTIVRPIAVDMEPDKTHTTPESRTLLVTLKGEYLLEVIVFGEEQISLLDQWSYRCGRGTVRRATDAELKALL
jgi:hypothetical protein